MGDKSSIEWTDATWNPLRGCSRVSAGCVNCYAERVAGRFSGVVDGKPQPYHGLITLGEKGPRWNGTVRVVTEHLADPLRWKRPRRIFVNSMSDLFHESVSNEDIAAIFGVMAAAPQHAFQVLTKRPKRMTEWFAWAEAAPHWDGTQGGGPSAAMTHALSCAPVPFPTWVGEEGDLLFDRVEGAGWPLPNVWLGVSVEDQKTADERIPVLLETPAAIRFVSYEPGLGPVNFAKWFDPWTCSGCEYHGEQFESGETRCADCNEDAVYDESLGSARCPKCGKDDGTSPDTVGETCPNCGNVESWSRDCGFKFQIDGDPYRTLDWIIVGGESGPGARLFDIGWARSVIEQCRGARVSVFVKQLGARPRSQVDGLDDLSWWKGSHVHADGTPRLADRAGGDVDEWPEDIRVRQFPEVRS